MRNFLVVRLLITALWLLPTAIACADHHTDEKPLRTITVNGEGKLKVKPDTASVSAGVVTQAATAREALDKNSERMRQVMQALRQAGIAQDDLQTSQFSVSPVYSRPPRKPNAPQQEPTIVGYRVSNTATAIVRKLADLGGVLDKVVTLGANSISGPSFFTEKPEPILDEARQKAVTNALQKAKLLAEAAGVELGPIMKIQEGGGYAPQPKKMYRAMAMEMDAASVPIAAGTQEIRATVNLVIAIE